MLIRKNTFGCGTTYLNRLLFPLLARFCEPCLARKKKAVHFETASTIGSFIE